MKGLGVVATIVAACFFAASAEADTFCVTPENSCPADHTSTTVTVLAPSGGGTGTGGNGGTGGTLTAPILSFLKLTPTAFRAATSGGSIVAAKQKTGSTVSYADTQPADTTFMVERAVPGVKRGRNCVQVRHPARRSKRCTLFVHVGGFVHRDVAGANRFHFTGRIDGKALSPGNYRLSAEPQNASLLVGNLVRTQFRIVAPPPRKRHRR